MIDPAIYSDNSTDCSDDAANGLITAIDACDLTDFADILIPDNVADELIDVDDGKSTDCVNINVLYDDVVGLIALVTDVKVNYVIMLELMAVRETDVLPFECVFSSKNNP